MGRPLWVDPAKKSTLSESTAQSRSPIRRPSPHRRSAADRRQQIREAREARLREHLASERGNALDGDLDAELSSGTILARPYSPLRRGRSGEAPDAMPSVLERLRYDYPRWRPQQISILRPADEEQREQEEEDEDQELEEQDIAGRQRRYEALRVASRQREAMRQGMRDGLTQSRRLASQQREVMQQVARQREAQRRLSLAYGVSMGEMTPLPLLPPREDETPERRTFHSEAEQFFDLMPMSFEDFIAGDDAAAERSLERPAALTEPTAQPFRSARRLQVRNVDGLGDRDRSLSPDPVAAWDTLQSTLTPDPQPPSAGSSFARVEEPEPPCDPLNETDAATPRPDGSRRSLPPRRRSYADVARAPSDASPSEIPDDPEWLSSLQQIVRNLASRQDIPDEWWARAGLSRSMSWEEDN